MGATWEEREQRLYRPLAVPLADAAEVLDVDLDAVQAAARGIQPYRHADGSPRWSLLHLRVALGLEPDEAGEGLSRPSATRSRRSAR